MSYRALYEERTGRAIPEGYEIHHMDFDRNNNDILNLVALPISLHREYHKKIDRAKDLADQLRFKLCPEMMGQSFNSQAMPFINDFMDVWSKCQFFVYLRDYFIGTVPDTHISIKEYPPFYSNFKLKVV